MNLSKMIYCNWNVYRCNLVDTTIRNMLAKKKHKKESQYFYIYKDEFNDIIYLLDIEYFRKHKESLTEYRKEYIRLVWKELFYMILCRYQNIKVYIREQVSDLGNDSQIYFPLDNYRNYTDSIYYENNEENIYYHDCRHFERYGYKKDPCFRWISNKEWVRIRYSCREEFIPDYIEINEMFIHYKIMFIDCKLNDDLIIRIADSKNIDMVKIIPEDTNNELFLLEASFYLNCNKLHVIEFKEGEVFNID